ncbi:MAG: hypothetical protein CMJ80_16420 [Planctomycetaceae bacterium]|nr:hypothetical protein [Planctomycetaceae bacterium]
MNYSGCGNLDKTIRKCETSHERNARTALAAASICLTSQTVCHVWSHLSKNPCIGEIPQKIAYSWSRHSDDDGTASVELHQLAAARSQIETAPAARIGPQRLRASRIRWLNRL